MEKIALLPGGFKPPHAGHYNMAKWLVANTDSDTIVIRVGSKERSGITREMSLKLWDLYREADPDSPPIAILASENNSPVADVYDFIEQEAPEGSKIYLGAGEKDKEDTRYNNIGKFANPKNIDFEIVLVPPQAGGVSGTEMRGFINDGDENNFKKYLPEHLTPEQKEKAWKIVTTKPEVEEDFYNPQNKYYNFAKSSEYKAGLPDGHKEDIPRAYKYKRGGMYTGPGMGGGMYEQKGGKTLRVYDFDDTLAVTKGANIKVKHTDGSIDTLNPAEFATYAEQEGDKFDFTEFDRVIKDAEPIQNIVSMLEKDLETTAKVTVLTARLMAYPVRRYLKTEHNLEAYVVAVGSSDPNDKAKWIENHIEKGYDDILFIDDSEKNRNAVASLKDKHPNIKLDVKDPDNLNEMMGGTMNNQEKAKHYKNLKRLKKDLRKQGDQYIKVPDYLKGTLTRKLYKEQTYRPKSSDNPYDYEENNSYTTSNALINDLTIPLEIMSTPEEQTTGMMDRKELKGGMIFPYDEVSRKDFHMENCLIPLDIVFIKGSTIGDIHHNCPPCKENHSCPKYSGLADNVLELPGGYCKKNNINKGDEINFNLTYPDSKPTYTLKEENIFTKRWWKKIITEHLLTEGGAAGHMAHPFNLPNVNSGKDLKDIFNKSAESLQNNPGSVKIDGVNSSIRLIDLDGTKQFVMDRGSKMALDIKGITKDDLENRFKKKDGSVHGMIAVGGAVLDIFNEALPSIKGDLEKLGVYDNPNILFNMEYVEGKTNVQDYDTNFIAIHGLNQIELDRTEVGQRESKEISYDKSAFQSLLDNLAPIAKEKGFEMHGSVPTEMTKDPNFSSALSTNYTIVSNEGEKTQTLDQWLNELNNIPEKDFIFINVDNSKKKIGAVSKLVYTTLLNGGNIDELFENEEDKQKAIEGFTTYLATEKLGDEVLKVLNSPMGSVENHEGVVIRDEGIANVPFKITGKFILGGMSSDF